MEEHFCSNPKCKYHKVVWVLDEDLGYPFGGWQPEVPAKVDTARCVLNLTSNGVPIKDYLCHSCYKVAHLVLSDIPGIVHGTKTQAWVLDWPDAPVLTVGEHKLSGVPVNQHFCENNVCHAHKWPASPATQRHITKEGVFIKRDSWVYWKDMPEIGGAGSVHVHLCEACYNVAEMVDPEL